MESQSPRSRIRFYFRDLKAHSQIYQWAYVDPNDPTQGVYQSTTLCPGGNGVSAVPDAYLFDLDLTQAYLIGANLTNANLSYGTLTNANLSNADLTSGTLSHATLTNANLTGASVAAASIGYSNLTASQLYSRPATKARTSRVSGYMATTCRDGTFPART